MTERLSRTIAGSVERTSFGEADHGADASQSGLYRTWVKTGQDEACDWTFTLDEAHNVLRWDMRQCPSKGFLRAHDLNADEDYCDHCLGWMAPLLVHPYWPRRPALDFTAHGLPRPLPLLPRLIRAGQYLHQPGGPVPSETALLLALARALGHPFTVLGQG